MFNYSVSTADLRTRITFQEPTVTKDGGGAQVQSYLNVVTDPVVWARWVNAHGQEAIQNNALTFAQRATDTVRYRSDILTTWQVLKDGEAWKIISIDEVRDRNRWTELVVERVKGTV